MAATDRKNICLAGNANCGKTTLFNLLTGLNYHTGNLPGVTVEVKTGKVKGREDIYLTDIPGIYSLNPLSLDEKAACDYLRKKSFDVIIAVIDGNNLRPGLVLASSLAALGKRMVLAVNFMDEVKKKGIDIDFRLLSALMGVEAVPVSAKTGEGKERLISAVLNAKTPSMDNLSPKRTDYIVKRVYKRRKENLTHLKADKILAGKYTALICFAAIMATGFYIIFGLLGPTLSDLAKTAFDNLGKHTYDLLTDLNVPGVLKGLICNGIIAGVGSVLTFLPVICLLFLFLSLLEDTGYMARVAFIADRLFVSAGLSGRAAVPLILGFGCTVPAVMATRPLGFENEKKRVIRLLPFMSCPAKIPVYLLLSSVFFPRHTYLAVTTLYLTGILFGVIYAFVLNLISKKKPPLFIMELPPYRFPSVKNTVRLMIEKSKEFIKKAATVILLTSVLLWFFGSYDFSLSPCDSESSMLGVVCRAVSPAFSPLGFGFWQAVLAIIAGLAAKEAAAGALILTCGDKITALFTPLSAVSFMTFVLFYTPCVAALESIKKETKSTLFMLSVGVFQFVFAYFTALLVYLLGSVL